MSSLKSRILAQLAEAGCSPLHRLGQNFMVDTAALDRLVGELGAAPGLRVAEIGPGTGVLTERLLAAGCQVLAVELDRGLHAFLTSRFAAEIASGALTLVHGDCLVSKSALHPALVAFAAAGPWRLGANLPYDVALPVLANAAGQPRQPDLAVVTVQYEAAQRLCAPAGSDAWGASAVVMQAAGRATLVCKLPPQCFHPRPRVDSAILRWQPRAPLPPGFSRWCRSVFAFRRKVLTRALRELGLERDQAEAACQACGLAMERRLEALDAAELLALHAACPAVDGADREGSDL